MDSAANNTENTLISLQERVKELSCLYDIARIAGQDNMETNAILTGIVEILPRAWLYPESACAKITFDGHSFATAKYRKSKYRQQCPITINGLHRGFIEIVYREAKPDRDEGPFLREERTLLDTVAKEVASIILHKEAEQDKLRLEEQLRHADRLAVIGQLAAGVAHELNEPLSHILGFAQLILKCPGLPLQAKEDTNKILDTSLYAREIVRKLLMFARKIPPQKLQIDLNHIVGESVNFFRSSCNHSGIEITCSFSSDLPHIHADPAQLNQAFVNVIANSMQSMPGGGKMHIITKKVRGKLVLIIEDTGVGMDKEILKKVFTPFFTTKEVGMGTGLGLPVAQGIIASHEGQIRLESKAGKGTRCEITLPVK